MFLKTRLQPVLCLTLLGKLTALSHALWLDLGAKSKKGREWGNTPEINFWLRPWKKHIGNLKHSLGAMMIGLSSPNLVWSIQLWELRTPRAMKTRRKNFLTLQWLSQRIQLCWNLVDWCIMGPRRTQNGSNPLTIKCKMADSAQVGNG